MAGARWTFKKDGWSTDVEGTYQFGELRILQDPLPTGPEQGDDLRLRA